MGILPDFAHSGAVFAVESQNIVGYAGNAMDDVYGAVLVTAQFLGVGADEIPLESVVPADPTTAAWSVQLSYLTPDGGNDDDHNFLWDGEKWVDANTTAPVSGVMIPAGQGLWVNNGTGVAMDLRSSGEVSKKDVAFALDENYGAVGTGNPFPVPVALEDVVPSPADALAWSVQASYLTPDGGNDDDHNFLWDGEKWVDANTTAPVSGVMIPAGQGLWVNNGSGLAGTLNIPAPGL